MKKFISVMLIIILLLSLSACKRQPETSDLGYTDDRAGGATAEIDGKAPENDDAQEETLRSSETDEEAEDEPKPLPRRPKTETEDPALEEKPLKYTAKHEPNPQLGLSYYEKKADFPIIHVINSKEQLEVLSPLFGGGDISLHIVYYHERTDSVPNDYNVPIKKERLSKLYDDSFFEKHVLVFVAAKENYPSSAPEVSRVSSDGTIEIDIHISKEQSDDPCEYYCDYIELDKEHAGLDFKVKYNEISVDEYIDTRAPLPKYPNSMDFNAKQFRVGFDINDNREQNRYPLIHVISSVQELEEYVDGVLKPHQHKTGENIDCLEYSRNKTIDFTLIKTDTLYRYKTTTINMYDYYNEEYFENNIICAVISNKTGSSCFQVRSVEPDGNITYEWYSSNVMTCDERFACNFIELDKSCKDLTFKTKNIGLEMSYYRWNKSE